MQNYKKSPIYHSSSKFSSQQCAPMFLEFIIIIIIIIIFIFLTSRLLQAAKRDLPLNIKKMQIKTAYETTLNVF